MLLAWPQLRDRMEALVALREELGKSGLSEAHAMQADEGAAAAAGGGGGAGAGAAGGRKGGKGAGGVTKGALQRLAKLAAKLDKLPTLQQVLACARLARGLRAACTRFQGDDCCGGGGVELQGAGRIVRFTRRGGASLGLAW